jgi:hypothetical protein
MQDALMLVASSIFIMESFQNKFRYRLECFENFSYFYGYSSYFSRPKYNFWKLLDILSRVQNVFIWVCPVLIIAKIFSYFFIRL